MGLNNRWLAVLLVLAMLPLSGCGFMKKLQARDNLNKGVKEFTNNKFADASKLFEASLEQDPEFETARMYLAVSYTQQFVPGSTAEKNEEMAYKAIDTYKMVLDKAKDPAYPNINAMLSIATIYYQLDKLDESKEWCIRILKAYPNSADACYRIAVMDFDESLKKTGPKGEMVKFMDAAEKAEYLGKIEEGLTYLNRAIQIQPNHYDAMSYQNLLWREKAKFEKDPAKQKELIREADRVQLEAIEKKLKAEKEAAKNPKKMGILGQ
jgi:tetratricopeptide (TPR) repeat protein